MSDNLGSIWDKFFSQRVRPLRDRFPGYYRSEVVETNDPLQMGRVRFKCPDLHDNDLKNDECPWAVPSHDLGGKHSGRFVSPCRGDWVWITFERQHPYGPVWTGMATPTRRKYYPYPGVAGKTPVPVDDKGAPQSAPNDYNDDYLPKDGRPMSHGWQDRYGNLDISSSVGYFPREHDFEPPPPDHDAVQGSAFSAASTKPKVNNPDVKYMAKVTKYGNAMVLGDQGYYWKKDGVNGEFTGDFDKDEGFEVKRWKYLQKLINENQPDSSVQFGDQRRCALWTRYGHRFELRDVGWGQAGPIESKSRDGEYGEPRLLSKETENDFRWIKLRTKGGMLLQASDKGFHPQEDRFVKRKLIEEVGHLSEHEDKHWKDKDARWWRLSTRWGIKLVLDDRGSDDRDADRKESPYGNGFLVKGRRSPAAATKERVGNPRGFYMEFNENSKLNHLTLGSPLGSAIEFNDRYEYVCLASSLGRGYATKWRGLEENEFLLQPTRHQSRDPEHRSHHLVIDHENEYIRLKSRSGSGPKPDHEVNPSGVKAGEQNQGLEIRDGQEGDGPWVELVDCESRGVWFSKDNGLGVWRGKKGSQMYQWLDDVNHTLVVYNDNDDGKTQIYCRGDLEIMAAKTITINAFDILNLKGGNELRLHGGDSLITLKSGKIEYRNDFEKGGTEVDDLVRPMLPDPVEPGDRAKTYNGPFEECPRDDVEHPTR